MCATHCHLQQSVGRPQRERSCGVAGGRLAGSGTGEETLSAVRGSSTGSDGAWRCAVVGLISTARSCPHPNRAVQAREPCVTCDSDCTELVLLGKDER